MIENPEKAEVASVDITSNAALGSLGTRENPLPQIFFVEVLLLLFLSLGKSAIYSILAIWDALTKTVPLNAQKTVINSEITPDRPWLDLAYQLTGLVFPLVPVALAGYFLYLSNDHEKIGFDLRRPIFDLSTGLLIALGIGIPGLAFYYFSVYLGINKQVLPANMQATVLAIVLMTGYAAMNAILEESIMLGFLGTRLSQLGFGIWGFILTSATIRGCYHLYQGFGGAIGNFVMGLVFAWLYLKIKRVMPFILAHFYLDFVAFVGFLLFRTWLNLG